MIVGTEGMAAMGRWVEIQRSWHDTAVTNCALCGRLVPRNVWMVEFNGQELPFCNEECEGIYRDYWLPKYGSNAQAAADTAASDS